MDKHEQKGIMETLKDLMSDERELELVSLLSKRYIEIRDTLTRGGLSSKTSHLRGLVFKATHDPPSV